MTEQYYQPHPVEQLSQDGKVTAYIPWQQQSPVKPDYAKMHHDACMAALIGFRGHPSDERPRDCINWAIEVANEYIKQLKERG